MVVCTRLLHSQCFVSGRVSLFSQHCFLSVQNSQTIFTPLKNVPYFLSSLNQKNSHLRYYGTESDEHQDKVELEMKNGLPYITVPLPSRKEKCCFILRPITQNVGDLLNMLQREDKGIDRVTIKTKDGIRIASSNSIQSLLEEDFHLVVNDVKYLVKAPIHEKLFKDDLEILSEVRHMVNHLYDALNVEEHNIKREKELKAQLEVLKTKLEPLEKEKDNLVSKSTTHTNVLKWVGLGMMSVQFGILARLTWWEYSWDIMEPVTYFVTYGTAMGMYAYYVLTKQEYYLPDVRDRQFLIHLHKKAKSVGFPLEQYNCLKNECASLEYEIARLRDPLQPPYKDSGLPISPMQSSGSSMSKLKHQIKMMLAKQTQGNAKIDTS